MKKEKMQYLLFLPPSDKKIIWILKFGPDTNILLRHQFSVQLYTLKKNEGILLHKHMRYQTVVFSVTLVWNRL